MSLAAVMAAVLCLIGPVALPVGPVPIALTGFGVCLAGGVLGSVQGCMAVLIYILLGAVGLPVFSGFAGGISVLAGPTGGYIMGYLPCAAIAGISKKNGKCMGLWMLLGTAVMYMLGTAWFVLQADVNAWAALSICVLPFLPGDILKIFAAVKTAKAINTALSSK